MLSANADSVFAALLGVKGEDLDVDTARKKTRLDHASVLEAMKELDEAGKARFVRGRRGWPTRLSQIDGAEVTTRSLVQNHTQRFVLARADPFYIGVPADLTTVEAERIARWLAAIAI